MKIKTVEIFGFKSFFEKTSLSFLPGITALVGPNGCGKSNIVDAIRWALGEQSAKNLRGNLMEDVIFNGSRNKKPLGMAEVSLTFFNENGGIPLKNQKFTEIQITRRVFRSGESEYYINKTPCRLKDITELFMDTGVGTRAYSIIEQGRVESIINSKPMELRLLIEEAAGISKYKARKQEALRKMDATRQNLLRVNDILREIERQIGSLKYQAKKLKRFKGLKERILKLELGLAAQKYTALANDQSRKETKLEEIKDRQAFLMAEMNRINAEIVARKTRLQEDEEKFTDTERRKIAIEYSLKEEENKIERMKEKVRDLEKQQKKATQEMEEHMSYLQQEEKEIEKSNVLKSQLQEEVRGLEAYLQREEEELSALKKDFTIIRNELEGKREELFTVRYERSRLENIIEQGEKAINECRRHIARNQEELQKAKIQLEAIKKQKADILREIEDSYQKKKYLEKEKEDSLKLISWLEGEIKDLTDSLSALKEKKARFESQLESLQELQKNFEGCSEGVRCIMQKKDELERMKDGIYGLVADFIETEPHLEVAVESILGEKLQYVIVKSQAEGIEAIEYLKSKSLGRVSFVPIETEKPIEFDDRYGNSPPYKATPLIDMIKVREDFKPIIRYLLRSTLLVEDFSQALSIWRNSESPYTLVTLSGEIIDPGGIITGGKQNGAGNGFLRKKREIKELEKKLSYLENELFSLQNKIEEKGKELEEKQMTLKNIEERLIQQKLSLQNRERDLHENTEEIQRIERKIEFLWLEKKKVAGELAELEEDLEANRSELEELDAKQLLLEDKFSELQKQEQEYREKLDSKEEGFNRSKARLMEIKAQLSSLISTLKFRQKTIENCRNEILKCQKLQVEAERGQAELRRRIEAAQDQTQVMIESYQQYQDELRERKIRLDESRYSLQEQEEKLKTVQQDLNLLQPSLQEIDRELALIKAEIRHLEERIENKYQISLREVVNRFPPEEYPEEETRVKLEKLEKAQERMMEGINFNAEREYEERLEKHKFYQLQAEDLNKSLDTLQEAIHRINRTSRERFRATFNKVNENFQQILPLVFEGGQGKLILTDESDLLETGVEIMVQPGGKSLKHISLLSGGEKALTAISLLFALYLIKPAPFCLLDEVDSPLDDANIDRFITILKKFASDSQFILVTHNKKTMEIADTLYGITMEEPGISKIVSVRLN
jgi:chromosome segregation protein